MREIERQASEAWLATPCEVLGAGVVGPVEARRAVAAYDFMVVQIPTQAQNSEQGGSAGPNPHLAGRDRPEKRRRKAHAGGGGGR